MSPKRDGPEIFLVILLLLGIYFKESWITFFTMVVLCVYIAAKYLRDQSLKKVTYQRKWFYRKGFPGEKTHFNLIVKNQKKIPLTWLRTVDPWPANVEIEEKEYLARSQSSDWDRL